MCFKKRTAFFVFCLTLLLIAGCSLNINDSIYIEDGEKVRGSQNSINGDIIIGDDCEVDGDSRTINGGIEVGRNSKVRDIEVVNGSIRLYDEVSVNGDVQTVNGDIWTYAGVTVRGEVFTVNGDIDLEGTRVGRNVSTYVGDITLTRKSTVEGDIVINDNHGKHEDDILIIIEVTDESVVEGDIRVVDEDVDVKVYISRGGRVDGRIVNAEVIKR